MKNNPSWCRIIQIGGGVGENEWLEKKIREEGMEGKMKSKMLVLEITRKRDMRN